METLSNRGDWLISKKHDHSGVSNGTPPELPTEMLEKICERLEADDLMTCRQLNDQWKEVSEKVLQDRVAAIFTKWNIKNDYNHWDLGIPTIVVPIDAPNSDHYYEISKKMFFLLLRLGVPHSTTVFPFVIGKQSNYGDPFPGGALRVDVELFSQEKQLDTVGFFKQFGHYLTHLVLVDYQKKIEEFVVFMSNFPNIKSLTLEDVALLYDGNRPMLDLPSLSYLTHLRIAVTGPITTLVYNRPELGLGWILETFSLQLVGITILGVSLAHLNSDPTSKQVRMTSLEFGNLKQLKINFSNIGILKVIETARLTHLHIMSDEDADVVSHSPCDSEKMDGQLLQLIQLFTYSLIYLRVSNKIYNVKSSHLPFHFPKLETLGFRVPSSYDEIITMRTDILPAFPALKNLEFIHYKINCDGIVSNINEQEYWKLCPKLEIMSVFNGRDSLSEQIAESDRRRVVWIAAR